MQPAFQRFAAQQRRVRQTEHLLNRLNQAQSRVRHTSSAVSSQLLRSSFDAANTVARSLDLALIVLDHERRALRQACRDAMARHGIPV